MITAFILGGCTATPDQPGSGPAPDRQASAARPAIPASTSPEIAAAAPRSAGPDDAGQHATEPAPPAYRDVWNRIRDGLELRRHTDLAPVRDKLDWYRRHQDYIDRVAERARPYLYYIVGELERRGMPLDLALLPIVESAYHPFAYSPSRASGIWQFIPGTGLHYGLKQNWWYDGRRDIVEATRAALDYLEKLHAEFNGDWLLALAAYNSGELNVARAVSRNHAAGKPTEFWHLRLPRETRGYVPSLLAVAELVANPALHNVRWQPIANEPYFAVVDLGGQIDLAMAAEMANLSMDELYTLNPGFSRWATDPDGPHRLVVPVAEQGDFESRLAGLPEEQRVSWQRHVIRPGDSLSAIADRYHTSIAALKTANKLRGSLIRVGDSLLIPRSSEPSSHYTLSADNRRFRGLERSGGGDGFVYTVQRGDTLWDIGRHYGVSVNEIARWSGIGNASLLRPGQRLVLRVRSEAESGNGGLIAAAMKTDETPVFNYTVKKGDSLWLISQRFDVSVTQLREWNSLDRRGHIHPGQVLVVREPSGEAAGA